MLVKLVQKIKHRFLVAKHIKH